MTDIPDWIEEKISFNPNDEVQDRTIVKVFLESEDPYLSSRKVASEVDMTKAGTTPRLEALVDIEVLESDSVAGGQIYWIKDERSDWPIPKDIKVDVGKNETTIQEFASTLYGMYGIIAVVVMMLGSVVMTGFTFFLAADVSLPWLGTDILLLAGMTLMLFGFGFVVAAALTAFWQEFMPELPVELTSWR